MISETKLNLIAVVHLKKDLKLDIDQIITKFAKIKSRKLNFYTDNYNELFFNINFPPMSES